MYTNTWSLRTTDTDRIHDNGIPKKPTLKLSFDGHSSDCHEYLNNALSSGHWLSSVEVTFRLRTDGISTDAEGILGIAERSSGTYLLECDVSAKLILDFVKAVRRYAAHHNDVVQYYLWLIADDGLVWDWEENMLITLTADGEVLRSQSLVPPEIDI